MKDSPKGFPIKDESASVRSTRPTDSRYSHPGLEFLSRPTPSSDYMSKYTSPSYSSSDDDDDWLTARFRSRWMGSP
jgi:hypothetical protein